MSDPLELTDALVKAARVAAEQDAREGGVRCGALVAWLITVTCRARAAGMTKEEFLAALTPEQRAWLRL